MEIDMGETSTSASGKELVEGRDREISKERRGETSSKVTNEGERDYVNGEEIVEHSLMIEQREIVEEVSVKEWKGSGAVKG